MSSKSDIKSLQKFLLTAFVIFLGIHFIVSISNSGSKRDDRVIYVEKNYASDGLDLQSVLELSKEVEGPDELEQMLNSQNGVNNLDLNEDGIVDYIYVTEYGDEDFKGFSLTVRPEEDQEQEIATLEFVKDQESVDMEVKGNESVYGHNHYYHSRVTLGDIILFNYLFRPHRMWVSPYYYGYHSYPRYRTVNYTTYRTRTKSYTSGATSKSRTSAAIKSSVKSPNSNKSANSIKAKLKNPTSTQKSFQKRTATATKSGGFGKKTSKATSVRKSSYSGSKSGGK